ncbi:hypothetical protein O7607_16110 [Micromonospora sp. WMMA1949]|uniref:hypothetical protein n=1 Tax=Micromonospora sp. WMMA1949 TaxID=3015162 RepID=UPI0022B751FA|nr:hypothetical protein [Micromonospora sp. WMMA1949]MCZ7427260.1 hypothetical protein [Micromonospora sp. WMMA1949]
MAFRTWGRLLLTALGVSVLAGAGQLGIAYGFGVVRLDGAFVDVSVNRWPAQLVWVGWFAAVATVAGAVLTERFARRDDSPGGTTELLSIAGVSALGAMVVAPLCMQPARAAELGGSVDPVWAVGICAALGAVVGAGAAIAVLLKPPFGWGVAITAGIVWLLALLSVAPTIVSSRPLATVRLGVLEPSWLDPEAAQRLSMLLLPVLALLAGGAVGVLARRAEWPPLVGGAAGAAGPVLVAFAYLTAGPGSATDRYQVAPYYGALIAVIAGALGSTATTMLPRPVTATGDPDAVEATDILAPLPHSSAPGVPAAPPEPPVTSGAAAPAHWNWPEPGGSAAAPAGTDLPAAARPALADLPAGDQPTVAKRPGDDRPAVADTSHGQPMPGLLPPGRRTSAIDVLAAGRPDPAPGPESGTAHAGSTGEAVTTDRAGISDRAVAGSAPGTSGQATGIPADSAAVSGTGSAAGTDDATPEPETTATAPRVTRPRRTRAGRSSGTADESTPPADGTTPRPGDDTSPSAGADTSPATGGTADSHVPGPRTDSGTLAGPLTADADSDAPATPRVEGAGDTSATGRATRPRRTRAPKAPRTAGPADTTPSGETDATPTAAIRRARPATDTAPIPQAASPARDDTSAASAPDRTDPGTPDGSLGSPASRTGSPAGDVDPAARTGRNFFFDDPAPAPSTRPRFPMFEDAAPGEVRPAWPITPAGRPHRATAGPDAPARDGAETSVPAEPAPRPRHRGLPEPGASAGWDALATNARPAGPVARPEAGPVARPEAVTAVPAEAVTALPDATAPETTSEPDSRRGRHAEPDDADAPAGKSKPLRGLFRRNRGAKSDSEPAERTAEPTTAADDEYVDWVAGLASDDNADDARSLRTGRHHRD